MSSNAAGNMEASQSPSETYRLWIHNEWYIPVNNKGVCVGQCAEGALGFIVKLHSSRPDRRYNLALKLPRLMGETHRENAYINDLLEKELFAVHDVLLKDNINTEGLLPPYRLTDGGPLRGEIITAFNTLDEARRWHGAIILVQFKRGHNPIFCLAKTNAENNEVEHFPPGADCPIPKTNTALINNLKTCSGSGQPSWIQTVFIESEIEGKDDKKIASVSSTSPYELKPENGSVLFNKDRALEKATIGKTWYTSVPSVTYLWAPGTLQEAISLNKRGGTWGISEHISLIERFCKGLHILHSQGMLHADLRPSNIAYRGSPTEPENYFLNDYGSFAETGARPSGDRPFRDPTGGTILGPVVGTERVSPFYAPERRAGREREAADTAVILNSNGGTTLHIVLGWQSELIDNQTLTVKKDIQNIIDEFNAHTETKSSAISLLEGDRIQIRAHIFDVIKAADIKDKQILECDKRFWKIYHGRIVVKSDESFDEKDWFPIPRTVELLQWSAATDLYSLGALALYSVYRHQTPELDKKSIDIEEDFHVMLGYLENEPYFKNIWPEIEWFREQLEDNLETHGHLSRDEFRNLKFQRRNGSNPTDNNVAGPQKKFRDEAIELVGRITQTVPGTHRLVKVLDFRLGPFILFIHFVLCCLHRRDHLNNTERWKELPFCEDRREAPRKDGGAKLAYDRLKVISRLLTNIGNLAVLDTDETEIPEFDPRPDPTIRVAMYNLSEQFNKTIIDGLEFVKEANTQVRALSEHLTKTIIDGLQLLKRAESNLSEQFDRTIINGLELVKEADSHIQGSSKHLTQIIRDENEFVKNRLLPVPNKRVEMLLGKVNQAIDFLKNNNSIRRIESLLNEAKKIVEDLKDADSFKRIGELLNEAKITVEGPKITGTLTKIEELLNEAKAALESSKSTDPTAGSEQSIAKTE